MYPASPFVEDFVGSDRALKRLALQRVRDIDLWKAPIVRIGEPVSEVKAKLADADLEIPLVVDDEGRPKGWLSERGLQGERVREDFRSPPSRSSSSTTSCATRCRTCCRPTRSTGRWWTPTAGSPACSRSRRSRTR